MGTSSVAVRRDLRRGRKPAVRAPRHSVPNAVARLPRPAAFVTVARPRRVDMLGPFRSVLEAIEVAACLVRASGEIVCANETAAVLVARGMTLPHPSFNGPIGRAASDPGWELTPVRIGVKGAGFLAVRRPQPNEGRVSDPIRTAIPHWRLTQRQGRVLALIRAGLTNADIAEQLGIRVGTVEFHVSAIFDKAGVQNRTMLIARVLDLGRS
jgi:DNA-binding CsgD family transcriptional regulator